MSYPLRCVTVTPRLARGLLRAAQLRDFYQRARGVPVAQRFDIRMEDDGTWTVFDKFTGLIVVVEGEPLIGLDIQDADDWVDLMNWFDRKNRGDDGEEP
jgi:hypothetical protein